MVDQRRDVLEQDTQLAVDHVGGLVGTEDARDHALLIDDVLAHQHRVFLELVDVEEEFLVDVFAQAHAAAVLADFLRHQLDHVGVEVDPVLQDAHQHVEARRIEARIEQDPALDVGETAQGNLADGGHRMAGQHEGDALHRVVLGARDQKVRIGEDRIDGLAVTRRTLDLLGLRAALQRGVEKYLDGPFLLTRGVEQIEPERILARDFLQDGEGFRNFGLPVAMVKDFDHFSSSLMG